MDMSPGDNHGDGMNTAGGGMTMVMMMQMSFYWGKGTTILFSGWPDEKTGMYVLCLLFIFVLAAVLEILYVALVMLAVMSFNVGVFIAAVLGHTLGFFVVKARAAAAAKNAVSNNSNGSSDKP